MPRAAWNVAIFCADLTAGDAAQRHLEATLAGLGLRVECHVRQWRFGEWNDSSVFEAAVEHALDADLVVLAVHDAGALPENLQAVLADWLIRSGNEASPLAITFDSGISIDDTCEQMLATLRRLTDRAHVPLYANFGDAVLVASDLWQWKHFPWAAAAAEPPGRRRLNFVSPGQRHAALRCLGASPGRARAGTGGTRRYAFTVFRHEPSVRRCQP